jgi:hypothetical protein
MLCTLLYVVQECGSTQLTALKSYDYGLEKTKLYTRIPLGAIIRLEKGN